MFLHTLLLLWGLAYSYYAVQLVLAGNHDEGDRRRRPNILLLLTDDQDVVLGSFDYMPKVRKLLHESGLTFTNAFVHTPVCCPSRSSILTGRYLHNGALAMNNSLSGNCYGKEWKEQIEKHHTFAIHAQQAGYTTAYTGKYLNRYGEDAPAQVPPGWDEWRGLVGNSHYYNCSLIEGGLGKPTTVQQYGNTYPDDYLPSIIQKQVLQWFSNLREPWLVVAAWPTPHGPFTPAPWAANTMSHVHAPITENYNASKKFMQQKHWLLRQLHPLSAETAAQVDRYYQMRLEALKSIDNYVEEMIDTLQDWGQLEDTVIMYTSDNGFQFGNHRLAMDKRHLYENDIRVPFCIRGPNIPANTSSSQIVASIDIAPTIIDIVQGDPDAKVLMDGLSFWDYIQGRNSDEIDFEDDFVKRQDLLISYHGEGQLPCGLANCPPPLDEIWWMPDSWNNTWNCVRTLQANHGGEDSIYCRFDDHEAFIEFYDLNRNPFQLENSADELDPVQRQRYDHRLHELTKSIPMVVNG